MTDKFEALESEAMTTPITLIWRDKKFDIGPPSRFMLRYMHYSVKGLPIEGIEFLLGEHYDEFMFAEPPPSPLEMAQLVEQALSAAGIDPGEAKASTD